MATKLIYNPQLEEGFQKLNISDFITNEVTSTTATATPFTALTIATNSVVSFEIRVTAIEAATGDCWVHLIKGAVKNIGGTVSLVDTVLYESVAESAGAVLWDALTTVSGLTLVTNVYGEAGKTIKWKSTTIYNEIKY